MPVIIISLALHTYLIVNEFFVKSKINTVKMLTFTLRQTKHLQIV